MATLDLSQMRWILTGWRPFTWRMGASLGSASGLQADAGPFMARVPGSVQGTLREAGVILDWDNGMDSRLCEWVEHRHWYFEAAIPAGSLSGSEPATLYADGLDYAGWILVDGVVVADFRGALIPHAFDLGDKLSDGEDHRIGIMFDEPPEEQGQFGYTSASRFFKPRYNYSWDWCPRIVPIGIWDRLYLCTGDTRLVSIGRVHTGLDAGLDTGRVTFTATGPEGTRLMATIMDGDRLILTRRWEMNGQSCQCEMGEMEVDAWWPNGLGDPKTYRLELSVADHSDRVVWADMRRIGFRRVEWGSCEDAPDGAEPWICSVNGRPVFLQGANWVPPRANYHESTFEDYAALIDLYREMGCNVLRVWGGGILETEAFYELCDDAGILVWQEFPLSSSGVENAPPDTAEAIAALRDIAASYILRRAHHPSLLLWSGGNELFVKREGVEVPVDDSHPCIAALKDVVERDDPGRRFVPASPSGPRIWRSEEGLGKGVHHDVHGPWGLGGFADLDAWRTYWETDDGLFRSEVGMPGAASWDQFRRFARGVRVWPPDSEYWIHTAAWWTQWDRFQQQLEGMDEITALDEYIRASQAFQAEAYEIAASACKRRFPKCGGFIIWMGHDCFPCPANNSVIDYSRTPKPAFEALRRVFRETP